MSLPPTPDPAMATPSADGTCAQRILIRGVNWLGDAVMTIPALLRLREARPQAHLALVTPAELVDLWRPHPAVDEAIPFHAGESPWSVARRLRAARFDLALVLPNSPRSALEVWLAGIPQRVGYARPWRNWWLTRAIPARPGAVPMRRRSTAEIRRLIRGPIPVAPRRLPPTAHHIYDYLHLVAALGASREPLPPVLTLADAELNAVRERFRLDTATHWLGVHAGAQYGPAKRWPSESFASVAEIVAAWPGWGVVLVGGRGDTVPAAGIEAALREARTHVRNLTGRTSLRELCAVLGLCRVVLTNDSGPMHVAAAVGTPVVALFGSTSPELTGPGGPSDPGPGGMRGEAPCAPCFRRECPIDLRCLRGLSVERVLAAVRAAGR